MEADTYNYPQDNHYQTKLLLLKLFQKITYLKLSYQCKYPMIRQICKTCLEQNHAIRIMLISVGVLKH